MTVDLDDGSELSLAHQEGYGLVALAEAIRVTDQASFDEAAGYARNLKGHIDRLQALYKPIKQRERAVWQKTVDDEKAMLEGPQAALALLTKGMTEYEQKQRLLQRAADQAAALDAATQLKDAVSPTVVPATVVPMPKADGVGFRSRWVGTVTDKLELIKAVAAGKFTPDLLEVNQPLLDEWARQMKGAMKVPGVKAEEVRSATIKGA